MLMGPKKLKLIRYACCMKIDTLFMMPIATKIVSSNPTHGEVYIMW